MFAIMTSNYDVITQLKIQQETISAQCVAEQFGIWAHSRALQQFYRQQYGSVRNKQYEQLTMQEEERSGS